MKNRWRDLFIDIFALNTFSYAVAVPIELWIAGMPLAAHLKVRLAALILNTLVARPYGIWRKKVLQYTRIDENSSRLHCYLADTLIFISFQLPLYCANMGLGGASLKSILTAVPAATLLAGFMGGPYGWYVDRIRNFFTPQRSVSCSITVNEK